MVKGINEYRTLLMAEKRELVVMPVMVKTDAVLKDVLKLYNCVAEGRCVKLTVKDGSADVEIRTDISLLNRVLINMVKNAIEASSEDEIVTIWAENHLDTVSFHVHNPAVMPKNTKTQIFKRTFTTKPSGSGLGTYSMKLLGENYLKGKVIFSSEAGAGTEFIFSLPV